MNTALQNLGCGALGMAFLIFTCYLLSVNRRAINWKLVGFGVLAQVMFAMGVLHTTLFGQPVFWMLFSVVVAFTIIRKAAKVRSGEAPLTTNRLDFILSVTWQLLFVGGLILAERFFGTWSGLAMTLSTLAIIGIAIKMGTRHAELMKWNILISTII